MTTRRPLKPHSIALSIGLLLVSMITTQIGAVLAKRLFPLVGASGATALRLSIAALILVAVWRPWRIRPSLHEARTIVIYGIAMGGMNFLFYSSVQRVPLGIAIALEFTGPLTLAMVTSRRQVDFVWILLAVLGLLALLPLRHESKLLDPMGLAFAIGAGVFWMIYIVAGQKAGNAHGGLTAALGTLIATLAIVPVGLAHAGTALFAPAILPLACVVAVLSSALPFSLEMIALIHLPTRTFSVLMSLEPAMGAALGLVLLGEKLTPVQWGAIGCIVAASAGSATANQRADRALRI